MNPKGVARVQLPVPPPSPSPTLHLCFSTTLTFPTFPHFFHSPLPPTSPTINPPSTRYPSTHHSITTINPPLQGGIDTSGESNGTTAVQENYNSIWSVDMDGTTVDMDKNAKEVYRKVIYEIQELGQKLAAIELDPTSDTLFVNSYFQNAGGKSVLRLPTTFPADSTFPSNTWSEEKTVRLQAVRVLLFFPFFSHTPAQHTFTTFFYIEESYPYCRSLTSIPRSST